jgi:hypothetical protein
MYRGPASGLGCIRRSWRSARSVEGTSRSTVSRCSSQGARVRTTESSALNEDACSRPRAERPSCTRSRLARSSSTDRKPRSPPLRRPVSRARSSLGLRSRGQSLRSGGPGSSQRAWPRPLSTSRRAPILQDSRSPPKQPGLRPGSRNRRAPFPSCTRPTCRPCRSPARRRRRWPRTPSPHPSRFSSEALPGTSRLLLRPRPSRDRALHPRRSSLLRPLSNPPSRLRSPRRPRPRRSPAGAMVTTTTRMAAHPARARRTNRPNCSPVRCRG